MSRCRILLSACVVASLVACSTEPRDTDNPFDAGPDFDALLDGVTFDTLDDAEPDTAGGEDAAGDTGQDIVQRDTSPDTTADAGGDATEPDAAPDVVEDTGPPPRCGDGILNGTELCEGDQFPPGIDCGAFGFLGGELRCSDSCTYDTSECYDNLCGDGIVTGDEQCESGDTATCGDLGFAPGGDEGELSCMDTCLYDTSVCSEAICGNEVLEADEDCDGAIAETCEDLGFAPGGEGAPLCLECGVDTSACEESICGNGVVEEEFEACDSDDVGGVTCRELGFFAGDVLCVEECSMVDTSSCVPNVCGSATVEGDEVCDDGAIPLTCADLGEEDGGPFIGGTLGCAEDCFAYDTSGCVPEGDELGTDTDEDGVPDDTDNCVNDANRLQLDIDGDGIGNVCDDPLRFDVLAETETGNVLSVAVGGDLPLALPTVELPVEGGVILLAFDDAGGVSLTVELIDLADASVPIDLGGGGLPIPLPVELALELTEGSFTGADELPAVLDTTLEQVLAGAFDLANPTFTVDGAISVDTGLLGASELTIEDEPVAVSSTSWDALTDTVTLTFDDPELTLGEASLGLPPLLTFTLALEGVTGTVVLEQAE